MAMDVVTRCGAGRWFVFDGNYVRLHEVEPLRRTNEFENRVRFTNDAARSGTVK